MSGGEKSCPRCGASFEDVRFECPFCGALVSPQDSKCSSCGTEFRAFAEGVSEVCSIDLDSDEAQNAPAASQKPSGETVEYECPSCGKPVSENDAECPHCGVRFA